MRTQQKHQKINRRKSMQKDTLKKTVSSRKKRTLLGALALVAVVAGTMSAFAAPTIPAGTDPLYALRDRLTPESQGYVFPPANPVAPFAWSNSIPNALADYYTYIPYSAADALLLGFPAPDTSVTPPKVFCGNKVARAGFVPTADDLASTEDCYTISVKRMNHNFELKSILDYYVLNVLGTPFNWPGGTNGLLNPAAPTYPAATANFSSTNTNPGLGWVTDTYGYGSGGVNWHPPGATAGVFVTGNAPGLFQQFPFGLLTGDADTGIWHFPAPTIKGTTGRPVRVQWANQLPNREIPGFDPTVDCGDTAPNCFPYNRIVTHVHGAHVGPESDGLAQAAYNPNFSNLGPRYHLFDNPNPITNPNTYGLFPAGPQGTSWYPMNQEASTIWYHDHAIGTTHLNTNQGMAGFFPITDPQEECLQGIGVGCTKLIPSGTTGTRDSAYELGLALQDRVFDTNGQFYMPDAKVIDSNFPSCDQATPASRAATCAPLFMYAKHVEDIPSLTPAGIHLVEYNEVTLDPTIVTVTDPLTGVVTPGNDQAPVLAQSATLEYFGNMPVVNGVVYGSYDVEQRVYRMRIIGGTDSRTWVLELEGYDVNGLSVGKIPFYQIGTEQGLLNAPVLRNTILLMPGERVDVLVDFKTLQAQGATRVVMNNLGGDGPYQGLPIVPADRSVDIPEIMQFNVGPINPATVDTPAPATITNLRPISGPIATLSTSVPIRKMALEEITDEYGRIMPTIDRRGYDLFGIPATDLIKLNDTEIWDVINTTADAHPMHVHQVAFQILGRIQLNIPNPAIKPTVYAFTPAINDTTNNVFTQPSYVGGALIAPAAFDAGWKDTAMMPPGWVTRIIAKFDIPGEYVWHCHILSHEEHDMMRPMVITADQAAAPAVFAIPAVSNNNRAAVINVGTTDVQPALLTNKKYTIEYKKVTNPVTTDWTTSLTITNSVNIQFPTDGVYDVRAKVEDAAVPTPGVYPANNAGPTFAPSAYTTASNQIVVQVTDVINPANGLLAPYSQTFTVAPSPLKRALWMSSTPDFSTIYSRAGIAPNAPSVTLNVPTNGVAAYARLLVYEPTGAHNPANGAPVTEIRSKDFTFTAASIPQLVIDQTTLPSYIRGTGPYTQQLSTTGGFGNKTWAITAGGLPAGLSLTTTGVTAGLISGTITAPASVTPYSFTVSVTDQQQNNLGQPAPVTVTQALSITVNPADVLQITTASPLTTYTLGSGAYASTTLAATGGEPGYVWSIFTGSSLPPGLTLTSGVIGGTPTAAGSFTFTVEATDTALVKATKALTLVVSPAPVIPVSITTPASITGATQGNLTVINLATANGTGPFTWTVTSGTLPAGLGLYGSSLVGIPLAGTYNFSLTVTDSAVTATTATRPFTLVIPTAVVATAGVISTPANGSTLAATSQAFTWNNSGATAYQLWVGSTQGNLDLGVFYPATANGTTTTATGLPNNGSTVHVRLYSLANGSWLFNDYSYTATGGVVATAATMVTPANNAVLAGASETFTWTASGASAYQVWVGSVPGATDYGVFLPATLNGTSVTATGLPVNGNALFVTLYSLVNGVWQTNAYTYTATGAPAAGTVVSPANNAVIAKNGQVFTWTATNATSYQLWIGTAVGGLDLGTYVPVPVTGTSVTVPTLPANTVVHATLYSLVNGAWVTTSTTYTTGP
jgi:spore coat protein A